MLRPIKPQPLWVRVDQNRVKLVIFVVTFIIGSALLLATAFVGVPGVMIGGAGVVLEWSPTSQIVRDVVLWWGGAFLVFLALGALGSAVQLSNAEDWVRSRFSAVPVQPGSEQVLERVAAHMALAAGVSTPARLLVIETESVNAGVIGLTRDDITLVVTRGMLRQLDEGELRAVVSTLVARVISGDVLFATALAALMGPLKAFREWRAGTGVAGSVVADGCATDGCDGCGCLFEAFDDTDSAEGCLAAIGIALFAALVIAVTYAAVVSAAWIVTIWGRILHRTSHEKADAEGMLLLKDPAPMLSALHTAVSSSNLIADGDVSYDGIFYVSTSGTPAIEKAEQRRYDRLREVLGTEGLATPLT